MDHPHQARDQIRWVNKETGQLVNKNKVRNWIYHANKKNKKLLHKYSKVDVTHPRFFFIIQFLQVYNVTAQKKLVKRLGKKKILNKKKKINKKSSYAEHN